MSADARWMDYARRLGHRALGTTAENPPVGCVIVKEQKLLGVGWTQSGGRPHAETEALAMAGESAKGATAYVTLEPCAHHGRTPPCAEALARAGIARVVTAVEDPDPRVSGGGHAILRSAGIEVVSGIAESEVRRDLAGFLSRIVKKRPYIVLKLAVSSDDKIAAVRGQRTPITGEEVRRRVHLIRAQCDGVLVGLSTILIDDPELTCRLPGMEKRSPIRLVADSRLSIPPHVKVVKMAPEVPLWLLATHKGVIGSGVRVIDCHATAQGWVDFQHAMVLLAENGLNRILVEGGSHIARSFLDLGLIDQLQLFRSPRVIGPTGIPAVAGMALSDVLGRFRLCDQETLGEDLLSVYEGAA